MARATERFALSITILNHKCYCSDDIKALDDALVKHGNIDQSFFTIVSEIPGTIKALKQPDKLERNIGELAARFFGPPAGSGK